MSAPLPSNSVQEAHHIPALLISSGFCPAAHPGLAQQLVGDPPCPKTTLAPALCSLPPALRPAESDRPRKPSLLHLSVPPRKLMRVSWSGLNCWSGAGSSLLCSAERFAEGHQAEGLVLPASAPIGGQRHQCLHVAIIRDRAPCPALA